MFAIGAIAVIAVIAVVRPGPAKETGNAVIVAQAYMPDPFAPPAAASIRDPSPFGYLEFDWVGSVPGFGTIGSRLTQSLSTEKSGQSNARL